MTDSHAVLRAISEQEFLSWDPVRQIIVHDFARRFCAIDLSEDPFGLALSWRGDSIEPLVVFRKETEIWIGVDQRLACVTKRGRVTASIGLNSHLLEISAFPDCVAILCESELLLFTDDQTIRTSRTLTEIPAGVRQRGDELVVWFDDGSEETIA